jgi:spermidine synthase
MGRSSKKNKGGTKRARKKSMNTIKDTLFNKNISVIKTHGEPILVVDGLIESGRILTHIWKTGIDYHLPKNFKPKSILFLGLGGGSNVIYAHQKFPDAKLTAIEIDPQMVEIANNFYELNKKVPKLEIVIADALDFINKLALDDPRSTIYDLVLVDCFVGKYIPKKLEDLDFIDGVKSHSKYTLINRIWFNEHHFDTIFFMKSLSTRHIFSKVHTSTNVILSLL